MKQAQWFVMIPVLILSAGLPAAQAGPDLDAKAAKYFTVKWSHIVYTKADAMLNSEGTPTPGTWENLSLTCDMTIRDPNRVLGTIPEGTITQLTGRQGQDLPVGSGPSRPRLQYERPRYQPRYTQPPKEPRWKTLMQSALRLSPNKGSTPRWISELQPGQMNLPLDARTLDQAGGQLRQVKGYFHALVAESFEHVDVPFEPNEQWVRLTPDVEVRLQEATRTGNSFRCRIDARPQEFWRPLNLGDPLPARLVVDRQFLGPDGKPLQQFMQSVLGLPAHVAGSASVSGTNGQVKAIRFVIAVHPTDCRIPFEFQRVPLPDPNRPPARHQAGK